MSAGSGIPLLTTASALPTTTIVNGPSVSPSVITMTTTNGIPNYARSDLELFDAFMSTQDDFTPDIK